MNDKEKYTPYIIAAILPLLVILSNNSFNFNFSFTSTLGIYFASFSCLVIMWQGISIFHTDLKKRYKLLFVILTITVFTIFAFIAAIYFNPIKNEAKVNWLIVFTVRLGFAFILFFSISLSRKYYQEREKLLLKNNSLQTENFNSQLNLLRNQINPHFIFNSLSTLSSMVRINSIHSEEYILKFSDVFRQILKNRLVSNITLKEEIKFLNNYLYLLKIRHQDSLIVDIQIKKESLHFNLPVFALQLLVDACIKNNVISELHPLKIQITISDANLLEVSNNYQPKKIRDNEFDQGIKYLTNSYELTGIADGVVIEQGETHYKTFLRLF